MSIQENDDPFAGVGVGAGEQWNPATSKSAGKPDKREKFPCEHCNGTGKYTGVRVHQDKGHCFACKGKGYFLTSKYDRMKAKQKTRESKERRLADAIESFNEQYPGLHQFLIGQAGWSGWAGSLATQIATKGGLTDKQVEAALQFRAKIEAKEAEKAAKKLEAARAEETATPTLARLAEGFLISAQRLKFPKMRLMTEDGQRVVLSRCSAASRTPGHINITDGGSYGNNRYFGRITPDGKALFKDAPESVKALLLAFEQDPDATMKVQGQLTGECCLCGLELTNAESIERGIGPICATKWGF